MPARGFHVCLGPSPEMPLPDDAIKHAHEGGAAVSATASATTAITTRMYIERYGYGNAVHEDAGREST